MGVEQHLVALARVGHQPERSRGAQLHVRYLQSAIDAANDQAFLAPVELEGLAHGEGQRHVRASRAAGALLRTPLAHVVGQAAVPAAVAGRLELLVQRPRRAPLLLGPVRVGRQRLLELHDERGQLGGGGGPLVPRRLRVASAQVLAHRVARQARRLRYLSHRLPVAVVHPQDLANHGHGDHSSFPLLLKKAAG